MSYGGRNPKRKHEYTTGPQPRRKRAPRGEETVIALTPLPSGLLIKEFTKQNRLVLHFSPSPASLSRLATRMLYRK